MKNLMSVFVLMFCVQSATAAPVTPAAQSEALKQLETAKSEIESVKTLVDLLQSIGLPGASEKLANAVLRIEFAQKVLIASVGTGGNTGGGYYCVMKTSFDGAFEGRGATELEAKTKAVKACDAKGVSFCNSYRPKCEKQP